MVINSINLSVLAEVDLRKISFVDRVINVLNWLPSAVDFSPLTAFERTVSLQVLIFPVLCDVTIATRYSEFEQCCR